MLELLLCRHKALWFVFYLFVYDEKVRYLEKLAQHCSYADPSKWKPPHTHTPATAY